MRGKDESSGKAYDTAAFARTCKAFGVEAHVARSTSDRRSNIGEEMGASEGHQASQVHCEPIEEVLGSVKTVARLSKTRHRGLPTGRRQGRGRLTGVSQQTTDRLSIANGWNVAREKAIFGQRERARFAAWEEKCWHLFCVQSKPHAVRSRSNPRAVPIT